MTRPDGAEALTRLGGVAGIGEWRRETTRAAARNALADGSVVLLRPRLVALPGLDAARAAAAASGGVVSHLSAATSHGWKVKATPARPTITVDRSSRRVRVDADVRWGRVSVAARALGVTTPVETVIDCARAHPFDVALCVADSALRADAVTVAELVDAAAASPRTGRARALRVAREAHGGAANPFESTLRAIALDVPRLHVRPQVRIGTIGRVDLADEELRIAIEADSWSFHGDDAAFRRDIRRYTDLVARGWLVLRFCWEDVMRAPERVGLTLRDTVATRRRHLGMSAVRAATSLG